MNVITLKNISKKYYIAHTGPMLMTLRDGLSHLTTYIFNILTRRPHKSVEEFYALKDISFTVTQGEIIGIIGKNGSGKSTLLKIVSRITRPTHGTAQIIGRVTSLLEVGTGFHPDLTGRENIYLNGAILGMTRKEINESFDKIVEFAEIEKFLDTPIKQYSSGMAIRLGFSVAAHLNPDILILDEVLSVGDVDFQKKSFQKMKELVRAHNRTVLYVSHDFESIKALCTEVIVLQHGTIAFKGQPTQAIHFLTNAS